MRRASRDYTKYLRGSEEMGSGSSSAPHEGPLHPAPSPAPHQSPPTSRSILMAFMVLGLGQVVCSVALFLYFKTQTYIWEPNFPRSSSVSPRSETRWCWTEDRVAVTSKPASARLGV